MNCCKRCGAYYRSECTCKPTPPASSDQGREERGSAATGGNKPEGESNV